MAVIVVVVLLLLPSAGVGAKEPKSQRWNGGTVGWWSGLASLEMDGAKLKKEG